VAAVEKMEQTKCEYFFGHRNRRGRFISIIVLLWYPKSAVTRFLAADFDHGHSLTSLTLPLAALGSLPLCAFSSNTFGQAKVLAVGDWTRFR